MDGGLEFGIKEMNPQRIPRDGACNLDSIIATIELDQRPSRHADAQAEMRALLDLMRDLAESPKDFYDKLVLTALDLSGADSTGISLLDEEQKRFIWPAVAGGLSPYVGEGTPPDFGPCGAVLERNETVLMRHPERYYTYLKPITPPLEEVLLVPFHMDGKPVGTIWAVIHTAGRSFDAEDKRLLESLSAFAASAYRALVDAGALKPMLKKPV